MARPEPAGLAVCDAGPLIHLEELGCLDLLADFSQVLVADVVWKEVQQHQPSALRRRKLKLLRTESLPDASPQLSQLADALLLASGEVGALRLMQENPHGILLTDDAAARLVAEQLGYDVHGTIGMLVRALRRQQRTKRQVLNLLRAIPRRSTLFMERRLLESVIDEVKRV